MRRACARRTDGAIAWERSAWGVGINGGRGGTPRPFPVLAKGIGLGQGSSSNPTSGSGKRSSGTDASGSRCRSCGFVRMSFQDRESKPWKPARDHPPRRARQARPTGDRPRLRTQRTLTTSRSHVRNSPKLPDLHPVLGRAVREDSERSEVGQRSETSAEQPGSRTWGTPARARSESAQATSASQPSNVPFLEPCPSEALAPHPSSPSASRPSPIRDGQVPPKEHPELAASVPSGAHRTRLHLPVATQVRTQMPRPQAGTGHGVAPPEPALQAGQAAATTPIQATPATSRPGAVRDSAPRPPRAESIKPTAPAYFSTLSPSTPIANWMSFQHSFFSPGLRSRYEGW